MSMRYFYFRMFLLYFIDGFIDDPSYTLLEVDFYLELDLSDIE